MTSTNRNRFEDPMGHHVTIAIKDSSLVERLCHYTVHVYTYGKDNYILKDAKPFQVLPDDTERSRVKGRIRLIWPHGEDELRVFAFPEEQ